MGIVEFGCGVDGLALAPDGPIEPAVDLRAISRGLKQVNTKLFHDISERHRACRVADTSATNSLSATLKPPKERVVACSGKIPPLGGGH